MPIPHGPRRRGRLTAIVTIGVAMTLAACSSSTSPSNETSAGQATLSADETKAIVEEAYIYGYPLVTMDMTRKQAEVKLDRVRVPAANRLGEAGSVRKIEVDNIPAGA